MFDRISVSRSRKNMESILCVSPQGPVTTVCFIFQRIANRRSNKNLYTCIHSSMIHGKPKGRNNTIVRRQVKDKQNVVHPYSGILFIFKKNKKKEILTHTATWMNLEDTMLSERSQKTGQIVSDSTHLRSLEESDP